MNRRLFLALAAGSLCPTARGDFVANLDKKQLPILDASLRSFLQATKDARRRMVSKYEDKAGNLGVAGEVERIAVERFSASAKSGSRRHQYYLGMILTELHLYTDSQGYSEKAKQWLSLADKQNHPGAAWYLIGSTPNANDPELCAKYKRAIHLGSLSALATCSYAVCIDLQGKDWMVDGPIVSEPEQAGVRTWAEVYFNWMLIYHFLIRWDKGGSYFRLSLPNSQLLEFIAGTMAPSGGFTEKVGFDVLRDLTQKAADMASNMDTDYYPEEIYGLVWHRMFRDGMK